MLLNSQDFNSLEYCNKRVICEFIYLEIFLFVGCHIKHSRYKQKRDFNDFNLFLGYLNVSAEQSTFEANCEDMLN